MSEQHGQPTSRALALVVAGANLVVCGTVTAVLLTVHDKGMPAGSALVTETSPTFTTTEPTTTTDELTDSPALSTEDYSTPEETTEETTDEPSQDYTQVTGAGGMTTYIPVTWPTKAASGHGSTQADDPNGTTMFVRYGGAPTAETDTYATHADYERQFAAQHANYVSLGLDRTDVRGMPAVDWEFEYDLDGVRRHVRSVYWLANGYDYFVYASSPVELWPDAQQILDVMLVNSTP